MKRSKNFYKLEEKGNGENGNKILVKAKRENRINNKDEEYDIDPSIQAYLTNTTLKTRPMDREDTLTIFIILKSVRFYFMIHIKGLKTDRMRDILYIVLSVS